MKILIAIAPMLLLTGCATAPILTANAQLVPAGRILAPDYFQPRNSQQVEVLIKRDSGVKAIANSALLHVDGHPVAKLAAGEIARLYLSPGRHLLGVTATVDPFGANPLFEIAAAVSKDSPQIYRIFMTSGTFEIAPTSY